MTGREFHPNGLLVIADGIVFPIFNELLNQGRLPNISRHIVERAVVDVENAISSHPSSTYENMQALNTGMFPYDPGATSYSAQSGTINDMLRFDNPSKGHTAKRKTIFHYVPANAISIHNPWNDGADDKHPGIYSLAALNYLRGWEGSNRAAVGRYEWALKNRQPLNFAEICFPAYDRFGHAKPDDLLKIEYMQLDRHIGKMMKALQDAGQYDETLVIFMADHSMSETHGQTNPNEVARDAGFKPRIGRTRNNFDSRIFSYGYGVGQIYMAKSVSASELEKRINRMLENEAVEHVIFPDENKRIVYSRNSVAEISKRDLAYPYQMKILSGSNPFGYSDELCDLLRKPHIAEESLLWTFNEEQPDAVVGIAESMQHPNSPHLRFLASPGYAFGSNRNLTHLPAIINSHRLRNHGTLHRADSQIPLIIAGPKIIEPRKVAYARNIDWMPTFLELAGYEVPQGLDGVSLLRR